MSRNQSQVFFKIESNTMTVEDMDSFAHQLILEIDPFAKIQKTLAKPEEIQYCITSNAYLSSEKLIHEYNYKQFEKCKTLAMWYRMNGKYEIMVEGAPENTTRRDYFLTLEKFGPIARVTPCKSNPGTAWIAFIYPNSAKEATLSLEKIGDKVISVTEVHNNKMLNQPIKSCPIKRKNFQRFHRTVSN